MGEALWFRESFLEGVTFQLGLEGRWHGQQAASGILQGS